MRYFLIGLKCPYLECYEQPLFLSVPDLGDLKESYRRSILSDPEQSYRMRAHEKQCVLYGTFDDFSGKLDVHEPKILFDLLPLFPAGFVSKKVSEAEEREQQKRQLFEEQMKFLAAQNAKESKDAKVQEGEVSNV